MSADNRYPIGIDAAFRELLRDVVRREIRDALSDRAQAPEASEYLSVGAAADLAGVAQGTIRMWIRSGHLVPYRAGRVYRVRRCDLEAFLRSGGHEVPEIVDLDERASALLSGSRRRVA